MHRKVVGAAFFGAAAMVAVVASPITPGCSMVYSAAVVVVVGAVAL